MPESSLISSRRVYAGRILNLDIDRVKYPDGSEGELELIHHPGASAVVPLLDPPDTSNPRVVLLRQYRYAAGGVIYEIPAGRLDTGEAVIECARRELEEETGYLADSISPLVTIYTTPGFTDERIHLFLAWGLTPGTARREKDEFLSTEVMPFSRALKLLASGEISDAKTAVALMHTALFRRGQQRE
ncbi:MAG: NUDIX domain-containing protein [Gemmatimonadaceae bacterium]